ncbi:TPA: hypothetical protein DIC20_05585 [Candidatus Dependentiae bacterium]|nr:MAG: hypothetical protein US03_C0010G0040 [candidate division TM6 bacterium GW2011_GWF2_36_131]KKQ02775.1 MAG: hypothetical protein US13_C0010G0035 [candidate division TM6 bacterium GW2011_GWE2_36_25]KKQ19127.1 MAG: hypothetical protein US32_C0015G0010 [candidate division TM6 bacterium GW2011_GWA2_36_9]HBR70427.1 hypothetical protein [Candidatus Dependentiae bacterium]HCU01136.1 hypothetical protein [Candidatus Dependentiae bacterium]
MKKISIILFLTLFFNTSFSGYSFDKEAFLGSLCIGTFTNLGKYKIPKNLVVLGLYTITLEDKNELMNAFGGHVSGIIFSTIAEKMNKHKKKSKAS